MFYHPNNKTLKKIIDLVLKLTMINFYFDTINIIKIIELITTYVSSI